MHRTKKRRRGEQAKNTLPACSEICPSYGSCEASRAVVQRRPFTPNLLCRVEHRQHANTSSEQTPLPEADAVALSRRAKGVQRGGYGGARHPQGVRSAPALLLNLREPTGCDMPRSSSPRQEGERGGERDLSWTTITNRKKLLVQMLGCLGSWKKANEPLAGPLEEKRKCLAHPQEGLRERERERERERDGYMAHKFYQRHGCPEQRLRHGSRSKRRASAVRPRRWFDLRKREREG